MNIRTLITTAVTLLAYLPSGAQNVKQEPQEDPVQKAIREFSQQDKAKPNEVTVVLPPTENIATPSAEAANTPVLVTGKPPEAEKTATENKSEPKETPNVKTDGESEVEAPTEEETPPEPPKGLAVRVEKLQTGTGNIDPKQVKLLAPFPAKPLATPPAGWHLETSDDAPPFSREVEIASGSRITLTIRPHLLVPNADGIHSFNITEPGYDASLGYYQEATVSAILSKSIRQLEDDSKHLGTAIEQLQQVLVSLPAPDPKPEPKAQTKNKR